MSFKKILFLVCTFFLTLLSSLLAFNRGKALGSISSGFSVPLPGFLTLLTNKQVATLDLWTPKTQLISNKKVKAPEILADSAISYDTTTNTMLFSKNSVKRLPMASLTKVMTAIIGLENKRSDNTYVVHHQDLVGEDSMGLDENEKLSLEDLLYGMILHSGNDAAETIASNYIKGRARFIEAMNDKVKTLGLKDTHFTNPTGLEGDGNQFTTVYDLLVITYYGLTHFPVFSQVASTFDYHIDQASTHKEFYLENETNLLSSYPGVKGVKTGYTPEAGLCLITYLSYKGHNIIAVLLNSNNRRQDMIDVLDYSLFVQGVTPPHHG